MSRSKLRAVATLFCGPRKGSHVVLPRQEEKGRVGSDSSKKKNGMNDRPMMKQRADQLLKRHASREVKGLDREHRSTARCREKRQKGQEITNRWERRANAGGDNKVLSENGRPGGRRKRLSHNTTKEEKMDVRAQKGARAQRTRWSTSAGGTSQSGKVSLVSWEGSARELLSL